jgi:predicted ATPase/GAF domain-containing protein
MQGYQNLKSIYQSERVNVYRAIRKIDGKSVILKTQTSEYPSIRDLTRIKYEFDLSQKFPISGMVPILALEKNGNGYTLVMEDVDGIPLLEYWNSSQRSIPIFLNLAIQLSNTLSDLHKYRIIHKDLKPSNILVQRETGKVFLIDLGLASLLQSEEQAPVQPDSLEGTLSYISPEQTGRMNRSIDFRSDLYSLGITFYELLTGKLPFTGEDPVELVHAHIAVVPVSPFSINKEIPPSLSDLILKLISKNAEDRYLSATGLFEDLSYAREQLLNGKFIQFIPGERESKGIFKIPERLYGREAEVSFLLDAFDRISESPEKVPEEGETEKYGGVKLVLVGGYSGVGKTALIQEVHKPILEKRGIFLFGKYDQFKRNIPYSSIIQAFTGHIRHILSKREEIIKEWNHKIVKACSPNTSLLLELIPELIHITGLQPKVEDLEPQQAEERFRKTFLKFVGVFSNSSHPLTLFLDDLQWADLPTLKFIELLNSSNEVHNLLLIGAYRDNEVDALHPLTHMIQNLEKENIHILKIFLTPLLEFFIERMICDTLHKEVGSELPELIHKKTGGNPFFVRQFLKTLYIDSCITYSSQLGWEYDLNKIYSVNYTENVVEMVASRLRALSKDTQEILKVASCIGDRFELKKLANIFGKGLSSTALQLREALQEGVILPLNQNYKSAELLEESTFLISERIFQSINYKFVHDRVQQAANTLLTEEDKILVHVKIGKSLLTEENTEAQQDQIFEIINHLNYGIENIKSEDERDLLITLNYKAGSKAVESFAYESAINFFGKGIYLVNYNTSQEFTFNLKYEYLNSMYKAGYVRETYEKIDEIFEVSTTKYEKAKAYSLKVICQTNLGEYENSVQSCINILKLFNFDISNNITGKDIFIYYKSLNKKIKDKSIDELYNLPIMKEREIQLVMEILMNTTSAAYWKLPFFATIFSLIMLELTITYGISIESAFGFSIFGVFLATLGNYKSAYSYGELGLRLSQKYYNSSTCLKVPLVNGFTINNWVLHSKLSAELMINSFEKYLEIKDIIYSSSIIINSTHILYIIATDLTKLSKKFNTYTLYLQKNNSINIFYSYNYLQTFIQILSANESTWYDFNNQKITEDQYIEKLFESELKLGVYLFYISKMNLDYLFKNYKKSYESYLLLKDYRSYGANMLNSAQDIFICSLLFLKINSFDSEPIKIDIIKELESNLKLYKNWCENNPANFLHKYHLILAEYSRYKNEYWEAGGHYEIALESAIQNEYNLEAGLCAELCGKFYLDLDRVVQAKKYFQISMYYYDLCGAKALCNQIKTFYPEFTNGTSNNLAVIQNSSISSSYSERSVMQFSLDTQSILRATQVIAEEIKLDDLLKKLLIITLENAGAQRGLLLLYENDQLNVEAEGLKENNKVTLFSGISLNNYSNIPQSIIQYSIRTSQAIILDSAVDDTEFGENPYIQREKVHSLLCNPIFSKGKLIGLLYLENNLLRGAFTKERVEILNMIVSQAAISIENARLYDSLEEKVKKRTLELGEQKHRLERIQNFTKMIQNAQDLDSMMENINSTFMNNFGIGSYLFYLCNTKYKKLELIYAISDIPFAESMKKKLMECPIPFGEENSTHNAVMKYKKAIFFKNARRGTLSKSENEIKNLLDISSLYVIPLINYGEVFAVFSIADTSSEFQDKQNLHKITRTQREDIELLCQSISSGLFQSLQKQELEKKTKYIEELNIFLKKINESNDLERVFHQIHDYTIKNFGIQHISIGVIDSSEKFAIPVIVSYPEDSYNKELLYSIKIPVVDTMGAHAYSFKTNKPLFTKKVKIKGITPEELKISEICNFNSCLIIPLILNNRNIGFLDFFNLKGFEMNLTKEQINQLSILAEQLAGIIYSSNLYQELQSQKQELESTLSELRTTQAQLVEAEKSAALGQLISGVAHEINNPLAAIRSSAEILEMDQEKFLEEIPFFFQRKAPEFLASFLELQKISDRKKRAQTTKEERQRKKMVFSKLDSFSFSSPNAREEISDLIAELWLEEDCTKLISTFSEENVLQILKYLSLSSVQKNSLKNIKLSTEKSARVIFSLRKYLKTEIRGTPRIVNIADLIESSLNVYDNYIRGIVTIEKNYSIQPSITCVVDEVQQVFKNLIFNAIQAMYQSETKILTIQIDPIEESQNSFCLVSFQDTGKGIDPNAEKHLFTPFYTTKSRGEGIGLGLYVSKAIMEEHGGRLEYMKIENKTTFRLHFCTDSDF